MSSPLTEEQGDDNEDRTLKCWRCGVTRCPILVQRVCATAAIALVPAVALALEVCLKSRGLPFAKLTPD